MLLSLLCAALTASCASNPPITENATGVRDGRFHTFWHDTGAGEMRLGRDGSYSVTWRLGENGNLVAGTGWARGSTDRMVRYAARTFDPGTNGYLTLYGWSRDPLVEYYVVERWGDFVPPGDSAAFLGTVDSDGGTYRIYRTRRVNQPSIVGTATFDQYWSVRTSMRPLGRENVITFSNHVAAWERVGLTLGTLDYQVMATEGFGSEGRSDVRVWE
ncbi:glycoside hydrolase family 11 protein [Brevundimonas sp.]|uniref:glycoside hydrolase family 11 protein n=1 Tax=Brevundimonas sp. TaxID=1871086 RepID=UPI0025B97BDC|nr:glycoside hydrolase family 11 protein [Brevundimonas sp.]